MKDAVTTPKTILEVMYSKEEKENDVEIWAYHCERRRLSAIEEEEKKKEKEKKNYVQQKRQKEAWDKIIRWNNPKNAMKEEEHKPPPLNDDGSGGNSTMYWTTNSAERSMVCLSLENHSWETKTNELYEENEERNDFCGEDYIGPIPTGHLQHTIVIDPKQINSCPFNTKENSLTLLLEGPDSCGRDGWTMTLSYLDEQLEDPHDPQGAHYTVSQWMITQLEGKTKLWYEKHKHQLARKGIIIEIVEGRERKRWKQKWKEYKEVRDMRIGI